MNKTRDRLLREFQDEEARREYAEDFGNSWIALQIKALRQERGWTQQELAELAGMQQSRISTMEQVDYSSWSIGILRRLAKAFDLPLVVRFESFGSLLGDILEFSREALQRPSFKDDEVFHRPADSEINAASSNTETRVLAFRLGKETKDVEVETVTSGIADGTHHG